VAFRKIKGRRASGTPPAGLPVTKHKRKGEIYKGASALGKISGIEAELMARRQREPTAPDESREKSKKEREGRSKVRGIGPDREIDNIPASSTVVEEQFETISTRASAQEIKAAERKVSIDPAKKADFLQGRLANLENIMNIIVGLVEMVVEPGNCEKCGKPITPAWRECPWCRVAAQNDELELKMSISGIDPKKHTVCPTCRSPLDPTWSRCPYCVTKGQ